MNIPRSLLLPGFLPHPEFPVLESLGSSVSGVVGFIRISGAGLLGARPRPAQGTWPTVGGLPESVSTPAVTVLTNREQDKRLVASCAHVC